jgi:hypothetical protein
MKVLSHLPLGVLPVALILATAGSPPPTQAQRMPLTQQELNVIIDGASARMIHVEAQGTVCGRKAAWYPRGMFQS